MATGSPSQVQSGRGVELNIHTPLAARLQEEDDCTYIPALVFMADYTVKFMPPPLTLNTEVIIKELPNKFSLNFSVNIRGASRK